MFIASLVYTGPTPSLLASELNNINRAAYYEAAVHVHEKLIPSRFTAYIHFALGAPRRTHKYNQRKITLFGEARPNVYTGESEALSKIQDITPTATRNMARAVIRIHSRKLNLKNPHSEVHPAVEMKTVADREVPGIAKSFARQMERGFREVSGTSKKKV